MRLSQRLLLAALGLAAAGCATRAPGPPPARPELRYYVKPAKDPALLDVTLVAERIESDSLDFTFPVWLPGDFHPIEPGKWVEDVRAYDRSTVELPVRRLGANRWRVYPRRAPYFLLSYTLHPVRPDGFKRSLISELTRAGGYFTGAVAFGYLKGLENYPLSLTFELPAGTPVVCSLESTGPARYRAPSVYELSQAGCAYGPRLRELPTVVRGIPHRLALVAPPDFVPDSLLQVVREVAESELALLGTPAYPEYTFFVQFVDPSAWTGLGGSPLYHGSAYYLPMIRSDRIRSSGIPFLLAHQLFHAWDLWAFPPAELSRPALDAPVDTRPLWFVEGFAEHYARVALARRGVLPREQIYGEIARNVRALAARPRAEGVNLETAGAAAARQADRGANEPLALKSPLAALALDVEMRRSSGGAFGTDSLVRFLETSTWGAAAASPALGVAGAARASGPAAASPASGTPVVVRAMPYDSIVGWMLKAGGAPVRSLYASAIAGRGRLPYAQVLAGAGLQLAKRDVEDLGLGAALVPDGQSGFVFRDIVPQGLGGRIGLLEGDRLVSVNGQPVTPDNLLPILAVVADLRSRLRDGESFRIEVERGGQHVDLKGYLEPWTRSVTTVVEDDRASAPQAAVREAIFSGARRQASAAASDWSNSSP